MGKFYRHKECEKPINRKKLEGKSVCISSVTDCRGIIDETTDIVREYWFKNLNLRGSYKKVILDYIHIKYPDLHEKYREIYLEKNNAYWDELVQFLDDYSRKLGINSINYFYHDKLVKK